MVGQAVIYLADRDYGERFVKYIREVVQPKITVMYFEEKEPFIKYIGKEAPLVLITEWLGNEISQLQEQGTEVVYLTEEPLDTYQNEDGINKVYRYQSMEQICAGWLKILKGKEDICANMDRHVEIQTGAVLITDCPMLGGLVVKLISDAAKGGKGTLMVDCTQFARGGEPTLFNTQSGSYGMSDFIYFLCEEGGLKNENLSKMMAHKDGIDYIGGVSQCLDLMEWRVETVPSFLQCIKETGYERVIFLVTAITKAIAEILAGCSWILSIKPAMNQVNGRDEEKVQLARILPEETMSSYEEITLWETKESIKQFQVRIANLLFQKV